MGKKSPQMKMPEMDKSLSGMPSWAASPPPMSRGSFGKDLQGGVREGATKKSPAKALGHKPAHKTHKKGK